MPLTHVPAPPVRPAPLLSPTSVPSPAHIQRLGAWLAPAHFVLSLLLLRLVYRSDAAWFAASVVTTLLASGPLTVGTRAINRPSLKGVAFLMYGLGYLNTLLGVLCLSRASLGADVLLIMLFAGFPVAFVFTLPFMLLDLPVLAASLRLEGPVRFDSRDQLLRVVSFHALAVSAIAFVAWALGFAMSNEPFPASDVPIGLAYATSAAAGGLGLLTWVSQRIRRRNAFAESVRRGQVPGYCVQLLGDAVPPPALHRHVDPLFEPEAVFYFEPVQENGAYRTGQQRIPLALV